MGRRRWLCCAAWGCRWPASASTTTPSSTLRIAHEMEEPKDRVTAGYLALCGAKGKPTQPEDKARNILWALKVVTRFNAPGDREWVALISALFAEVQRWRQRGARASTINFTCANISGRCTPPTRKPPWPITICKPPIPRRCVRSTPGSIAGQPSNTRSKAAHALELFERTFADPEPGPRLLCREALGLGRAGVHLSGTGGRPRSRAFSRGPGPQLCRPRARNCCWPAPKAGTGRPTRCRAGRRPTFSTSLLRTILAASIAWLSCTIASGHPEQAVQLLESWYNHHPHDPRPLVRFAILLHQRGLTGECQTKLAAALESLRWSTAGTHRLSGSQTHSRKGP